MHAQTHRRTGPNQYAPSTSSTSNWRYKMHVISNAKIDFLRFWLTTFFFFFCWENLGSFIWKNGKLTHHVCFVYGALFFFDGIGEKPRVGHHELNNNYTSRLMTKPTMWLSAKRRLRSAWASTQSDQSLRCPHEESFGPWLPIERTAKTQISLGGGCPGWSESSLGAHSLCWFCHEAAQINFSVILPGELPFCLLFMCSTDHFGFMDKN